MGRHRGYPSQSISGRHGGGPGGGPSLLLVSGAGETEADSAHVPHQKARSNNDDSSKADDCIQNTTHRSRDDVRGGRHGRRPKCKLLPQRRLEGYSPAFSFIHLLPLTDSRLALFARIQGSACRGDLSSRTYQSNGNSDVSGWCPGPKIPRHFGDRTPS